MTGLDAACGGRRNGAALLAAALTLSLTACSSEAQQTAPAATTPDRVIGLSTSLPIYWPEAGNIGDMLDSDVPVHWARAELESMGQLRPLDTLTGGENGALDLPKDALLVLAQPYPFSPDELVALDDWVRSGGHVLLFADPLATYHSDFALGDRRRPQDVAMLSPILRRWGLSMAFDQDQPGGPRSAEAFGLTLPVNLPGQLSAAEGEDATCRIAASLLAARCSIGRGAALIVADSALFDAHESADGSGPGEDRGESLRALVKLSQPDN